MLRNYLACLLVLSPPPLRMRKSSRLMVRQAYRLLARQRYGRYLDGAPAASRPTNRINGWPPDATRAARSSHHCGNIDRESVSRLGFAWQFKTGTYRGMEATPMMVDGVSLCTSRESGARHTRWTRRRARGFGPSIRTAIPTFARWVGDDVSTRGLTVWQGKVYAIATDCRLFALDARTGDIVAWQTPTLGREHTGIRMLRRAASGRPRGRGGKRRRREQ